MNWPIKLTVYPTLSATADFVFAFAQLILNLPTTSRVLVKTWTEVFFMQDIKQVITRWCVRSVVLDDFVILVGKRTITVSCVLAIRDNVWYYILYPGQLFITITND